MNNIFEIMKDCGLLQQAADGIRTGIGISCKFIIFVLQTLGLKCKSEVCNIE